MEAKKYLPLGSVVLLNGGTHRVMVVGFCTIDETVDSKMYDYMGCFYPEGIFSFENMLAFNHRDVQKIFYMGYSDKEEKAFKVKLVELQQKYADENGNLKVTPEQILENETNN